MPDTHHQKTEPDQPLLYQIRLEGHLGRQWADWFGGVTITPDKHGNTVLTALAVDQAALYGLLRKVRDLGLPLLSVNRLEPSPVNTPDAGR
ncbi:MAG: hypothetical protein D6768_10955 [Chloroflexi bacterium]|nr:MAG: hypothetical protein D6768_10955 [Chloroflexota bacterium]